MVTLDQFVTDFARGMKLADERRPVAVNARTKVAFQAGIGPHSETETVKLVMKELEALHPEAYRQYQIGVPYPENTRQKCDLCLGQPPSWEWAVEVKMLRLFGDNGKLNDNMLMHILSPYSEHRSALTDCDKLMASKLKGQKAIAIYAFDAPQFPVEPAVRAFELLARDRAQLSSRFSAQFSELIHPVHSHGLIAAWEVSDRKASPTAH